MYEMTEVVGEDGVRRENPTPSAWLTAAELGRWATEVGMHRAVSGLLPKPDLGRGRPVLVVPGFGATDGMTKRMRNHLRERGFHVHGWRLGRNYGLTDEILDGLSQRLERLAERHDEPLILVGWSFGGLLCRWLAHEHTDKVRHVVTLGSPWRAEGERTRVTALFKSAVQIFGVSDRAEDVLDALRQPLPVPTTAIFSRSDGLLHWRSCVVEGAQTENVAVPSSHVGLVSNPLALAVLADRLAHVDSAHVPFGWRACVRQMFEASPSRPSSQQVPMDPSAVDSGCA